MGIVGHAAKANIALQSLSVDVQCDWNVAGVFGLEDTVPPSYTAVRVLVNVESRASPDAVREVVAAAERYSPYVDVFRRALDVSLEVTVASDPED